MNENTKIGALWVRENDKGKYMAGVIELPEGSTNIVIFKNKFKKLDKHPEYVIFKRREAQEVNTSNDIDIDDLPL